MKWFTSWGYIIAGIAGIGLFVASLFFANLPGVIVRAAIAMIISILMLFRGLRNLRQNRGIDDARDSS